MRPVQQVAIAGHGDRLVLFLRSHLDEPALPGHDDPGVLVEWGGAAWGAPIQVTDQCHDPDVAVGSGVVGMVWTDDTIRPNVHCEPSCGPLGLLSYDSARSMRAAVVGAFPIASYTKVSGGSDRLYVLRADGGGDGPPELAGGAQCFDDPYFHCPSVGSPSVTPNGDASWIAAYVAFALDGACVGVRRGTALPETCLLALAGASPHAVEVVMANGEPFVLWAELQSGPRGTSDRANAARFDALAGWVLADSPTGFAAGSGLTWTRIRAVSDGATVTALYERSDGALFARRWNAAGGFGETMTIAADGATSSDVALHQGAPIAAYVRGGSVQVEPVPEPCPAALASACAAVLGALRARRRDREAG